MDKLYLTLAIGRVVERILISGGALLAMYFGWQLFANGVLVEQSASGEFKGAKIILGKVGPGIFFAIFATATFVYALHSPLDIPNIAVLNNSQKSLSTNSVAPVVHYEGPSASTDAIRAINAISEALKTTKETRVKRALETQQQQKNIMLLQSFSGEDVAFYFKNADAYHLNSPVFSPDDQKRLKAVDFIATAQFDD